MSHYIYIDFNLKDIDVIVCFKKYLWIQVIFLFIYYGLSQKVRREIVASTALFKFKPDIIICIITIIENSALVPACSLWVMLKNNV